MDGNCSDIKFTVDNLDRLIKELEDVNLVGINIMHTNFNVITPAVKIVKKWMALNGKNHFKIGVYPDHGYWKIPQWIFEEIDDEMAENYGKEWVDLGVGMIGGCCGTS